MSPPEPDPPPGGRPDGTARPAAPPESSPPPGAPLQRTARPPAAPDTAGDQGTEAGLRPEATASSPAPPGSVGYRLGPQAAARAELLALVAARVPVGRVRVGVDGRDGAGKTVFADELAAVLRAAGRTVVRASVDGFHRPRAERYRRGRTSPLGYWLDAFDYDRLTSALLDPFGRAEPVRTAVHDVRTDAVLDLPPAPVGPDDVLIVDGVFVHRDELAGYWDFSLYLYVDLAVSLARMSARDNRPIETTPRYTGAHRLYVEACDPLRRASVVVDNTDLATPRMINIAR